MKQIILNIKPEILERLNRAAECSKKTLQEIIVNAIEEHLEEDEQRYILHSSFFTEPKTFNFTDEESPMTEEYYKNLY